MREGSYGPGSGSGYGSTSGAEVSWGCPVDRCFSHRSRCDGLLGSSGSDGDGIGPRRTCGVLSKSHRSHFANCESPVTAPPKATRVPSAKIHSMAPRACARQHRKATSISPRARAPYLQTIVTIGDYGMPQLVKSKSDVARLANRESDVPPKVFNADGANLGVLPQNVEVEQRIHAYTLSSPRQVCQSLAFC